MKSEWMITSNRIGDTTKYAVYRLINDHEPDHSGNREFASEYKESLEEAIAIADALNE